MFNSSPTGVGGIVGASARAVPVHINRPALGESVMKNLFARFVREEAGQDLIEYSLLAAIISICAIVGMGLVATEIKGVFTKIVDALNG
jgi:pilus assembly protein Flp/PilA